MSNSHDNDTPKPAESGPLDLEALDHMKDDWSTEWWSAMVYEMVEPYIAEIKRLRSELAELKTEDALWWNNHHE
jgi:hypothetical protein